MSNQTLQNTRDFVTELTKHPLFMQADEFFREELAIKASMVLANPAMDIALGSFENQHEFMFKTELAEDVKNQIVSIASYLCTVSFHAILLRPSNFVHIFALAKKYKEEGYMATDYIYKVNQFLLNKEGDLYFAYKGIVAGWGMPSQLQKRHKILSEALEQIA